MKQQRQIKIINNNSCSVEKTAQPSLWSASPGAALLKEARQSEAMLEFLRQTQNRAN